MSSEIAMYLHYSRHYNSKRRRKSPHVITRPYGYVEKSHPIITTTYSVPQFGALSKMSQTKIKNFPSVRSAAIVLNHSVEVKDFLGRYSKIYAILWLFKAMFMPDHTWPWFWIEYQATRFPPWEVFEYQGIKTILTPSYRLLALDGTDPRIREGLRLSLEAIKRTNERLSEAGVRFLVLFIPTKELVLDPYMKSIKMKDPDVCRLLQANEKRVWQTIREYLIDHQIPYADALPALRRSVEAGKNPFLINHDAHPNAAGHEALAITVLSEIKQRKLLN